MPQPCLLFAGSAFESSPAHKLARSILLDTLRGQVVDSLDLKVGPPSLQPFGRAPAQGRQAYPWTDSRLAAHGWPCPWLLGVLGMM